VFGRLGEQGIVLEVTERFKDRLVERVTTPATEQNLYVEAIMRLEDSLADPIRSNQDGDTATVDMKMAR